MPTYTLTDTKTGESNDVLCSWDDLEKMKKANPNLRQEISTPMIVSGVGGIKKDGGWTDMLKTIKKGAGRGNTIDV